MPLTASGLISLNQIHVEAGGGSGTQVSINDSDVRGLIGKSSGAQMSFSEWYGASAITEVTHDMFGQPVGYYFGGLKGAPPSIMMHVLDNVGSSFGPSLSVAQAQTALGLPTNKGIYSVEAPTVILFGNGTIAHSFHAYSTSTYGTQISEGYSVVSIPTNLVSIRIRFGRSSSYTGGDVTLLRSQMTMTHAWNSVTGSSPYQNVYDMGFSPTFTSVANFVNGYAASPTYQSLYVKLTYKWQA